MNRLSLYLKSQSELRAIIRDLTASLDLAVTELNASRLREGKLEADLVDARFDILKPGMRREG